MFTRSFYKQIQLVYCKIFITFFYFNQKLQLKSKDKIFCFFLIFFPPSCEQCQYSCSHSEKVLANECYVKNGVFLRKQTRTKIMLNCTIFQLCLVQLVTAWAYILFCIIFGTVLLNSAIGQKRQTSKNKEYIK